MRRVDSVYSCSSRLPETVQQPFIHLASNAAGVSLAFLSSLLGITSRPEQEGIPVDMRSATATPGLKTKTQRDTDAAVGYQNAGQEDPLSFSADMRSLLTDKHLSKFAPCECCRPLSSKHLDSFLSDKVQYLKAQTKFWNSQLQNPNCVGKFTNIQMTDEKCPRTDSKLPLVPRLSAAAMLVSSFPVVLSEKQIPAVSRTKIALQTADATDSKGG